MQIINFGYKILKSFYAFYYTRKIHKAAVSFRKNIRVIHFAAYDHILRYRNTCTASVSITESGSYNRQGKDYFLIKDQCLTELEPEETDEKGVGRTLTCIGFRPLPDETAHQISHKFQLYK
nr:peptidyl-tRNA hydrolase [Ruminococcus flavefaciens]